MKKLTLALFLAGNAALATPKLVYQNDFQLPYPMNQISPAPDFGLVRGTAHGQFMQSYVLRNEMGAIGANPALSVLNRPAIGAKYEAEVRFGAMSVISWLTAKFAVKGGLVFGLRDNANYGVMFLFDNQSTGYNCELGEYVNNVYQRRGLAANCLTPRSAWGTAAINVSGTSAKMMIGGRTVLTVTYPRTLEGKFGLWGGGGRNAESTFDDIKIYEEVELPQFTHQNPTNRYDVTNDGVVSPIDALMIINSLNERGPRRLPELPLGVQPEIYLDVDGDGYLGPIDSLLIINYLNTPR